MTTTNTEFERYENLSGQDVAEMLGQPYRKSGGCCLTACYNVQAHSNGDRKPSLAIYGYDKGFHCFGCNESGTTSWLLKQFGVRPDNYQPITIERPTMEEDSRDKISDNPAYCERLKALWESLPELPEEAVEMMYSKGLDPNMFDEIGTLSPMMKWKWHTNQVRGWCEGVFIPYVFQGRMITARLRVLNPAEGQPRFLSMPGNIMYPYNLDAVMQNKRCFATEGETDSLTANLLGLPTAAIPGATSGKAISKLFEVAQNYGTELVIIGDNDPAGQAFIKRMQLMGYEHKVAVDVVEVPAYKDLNDWFVKGDMDKISAWASSLLPKNRAVTNKAPETIPTQPAQTEISLEAINEISPGNRPYHE